MPNEAMFQSNFADALQNITQFLVIKIIKFSIKLLREIACHIFAALPNHFC